LVPLANPKAATNSSLSSVSCVASEKCIATGQTTIFPSEGQTLSEGLLPAPASTDPPSSAISGERWIVERTISWLHANRDLARRHARRADIHEAMLTLACTRICLK
jgi:transposase